MAINIHSTAKKLEAFEFRELFIEELGWNRPTGLRSDTWPSKGLTVTRRPIAELGGVVVFEVSTADGLIPDEQGRETIHTDIARYHLENLLIFIDRERTSSLWYWVKRDDGKRYPRRHTYVRGQEPQLLIGKLSAMFVDLGELEAGTVTLVEVARKLRDALDVEPITKRFFSDFQRLHGTLLEAIGGVSDERDRRWYASVLLNRLMFVYFLQERGFLDGGDLRYLHHKLDQVQGQGQDRFYRAFLQPLFFQGFGTPEDQRDPGVAALIGKIRYLNGGLFLPHEVEQKYTALAIPDHVFKEILDLFNGYDWALDDSPSGNQKEINPAVLGYIFEKYINQKAFGAYYTRAEITEYLCEQTIHRLVLERVNESLPPGTRRYDSMGDLLLRPSDQVCWLLLRKILPELRLLDPACGSGAFLVAAMRTLIEIYTALVGRAKLSTDTNLKGWLAKIERDHPSVGYYIKKQIILNNLYGVDIMAEAVEIARLRLFLALVGAATTVDDLEPLPNIDFNILSGNALIGLLRVDEERAEKKHAAHQAEQLSLFSDSKRESYRRIVEEKNRLVESYRYTAQTIKGHDLAALRAEIQRHRSEAAEILDELLLEDFQALGIRYEQATWDMTKGKEGKPVKRPLTLSDIRTLQPFHWGYEFDEVMNVSRGFDVILANPPWETLKPEAKEFFAEHSQLVSKKKMNVKDFEQEQAKLLQDQEVLSAWVRYLSRFPHQSEFYRSAPQYSHQSATVTGKRTGSDINFYKLFVEQCFNLLRKGGQCGLVTPSGIYSDMGATGLRNMLFDETSVQSVLSVSNERFLFEGVHHSFKYVFLVFEKGGKTSKFEAAFRINPREAIGIAEIDNFLNNPHQHMEVTVDIVRMLSPETLSVMEFRNTVDIDLVQKLLQYPRLGDKLNNSWNFKLANEFHISNDRVLLLTSFGPGRLPLFTGKMFNQFTITDEHSGYWVDEKAGRQALLGKITDIGQRMDYQDYRWVHRRIANSQNERTFITTIAPRMVFTEVNSTVLNVQESGITLKEQLYLCAVCNSVTLDWMLRQKVAATLNMFYIYQLPVPRLTEKDPRFVPLVERAAKLICTTPEYDELAKEVGLGDHTAGVTDPAERNRLRAELDGLVAHLYGLDEAELCHILKTFPLVADEQKEAVLTAYRAFAPNPDDAQVASLIAAGESERVEFKVGAIWNARHPAGPRVEPAMRDNITQTVAAFMNSRAGGSLFIGVADDGTVVGIADDIANADTSKPNVDGYELWLRNYISTKLGGSQTLSYRISFHKVGTQQVCRIAVQPAPGPVYVGGELYVRDGNRKKKLNPQEAGDYIAQRWPR